MKVKITKSSVKTYWYAKKIGEVFAVEQENGGKYKLIDEWSFIMAQDAEVVQGVEKSCETCKAISYDAECKDCADLNNWTNKRRIAGVGADVPIVTNSQGGKQSKIATAFSLVPHDSLLAVAKVMKVGSERYEKDNWRKLSADEIYDHLMEHLVNWHLNGDMEELEHGMTRAMMLYSVVNHD